jgi:hypothetical protein
MVNTQLFSTNLNISLSSLLFKKFMTIHNPEFPYEIACTYTYTCVCAFAVCIYVYVHIYIHTQTHQPKGSLIEEQSVGEVKPLYCIAHGIPF